MVDVFAKRIRRAEQLEKEWPFAAELLAFYRQVWAIQSETFSPFAPLSGVPKLLALVEREGPEELSSRVGSLAETEALLEKAAGGGETGNPLVEFLLRVTAEIDWTWRLVQSTPPSVAERVDRCSNCGGFPIVSVLREDKSAETVRRSLICVRCSHEWSFARVLCPGCREERPEKLPRYTAQEIPWMRVEACDSCGKYLKSVDLTLNWDAEPVVDELASTPLDVIAREHGYTKIAPNLAGI